LGITATALLAVAITAGLQYHWHGRFMPSSQDVKPQAGAPSPVSERPIHDPMVVRSGSGWQVVVPERLSEAIKKNFPQFHLPMRSDLTGGWAGGETSGRFPFITWGDFNGDGLTDIAVVLLNDKEWKFAIFHRQPDDSYGLGHSAGGLFGSGENASVTSPQDISLLRVKKGVEHKVQAGGQTFTYTFDTDAIQMGVNESGLYIIYWKNGKYEELSFVE
jgi:hypothetical protein